MSVLPPSRLRLTQRHCLQNDPFLWSEDNGNSFYLLTSGSRLDQNGPTGVPQALLWFSDDWPNFKHWSYESRFWHGDYATYGPRTSCVDTFKLPTADGKVQKQVFLFSDCKLHRDRWFVGTMNAQHEFQVEREGVADWGRLYASQSMADSTGTRHLLMGNIGHPVWCTGPHVMTMPFQMLSLPREMSLALSGDLRFSPARELRQARVGTPANATGVHISSTAPVQLANGRKLGDTLEIKLHLKSWISAPPGAMCGIRLWSPKPSKCSLIVGFAAEHVVVQSSCRRNSSLGELSTGHNWVPCPTGAGDANSTIPLAARNAGYCYNVSLDGPTANASLSVFVDKTVAEVFSSAAGGNQNEAGVVISSGVFLNQNGNESVVEMLCHGGGEAVLDVSAWPLAVPTDPQELSGNIKTDDTQNSVLHALLWNGGMNRFDVSWDSNTRGAITSRHELEFRNARQRFAAEILSALETGEITKRAESMSAALACQAFLTDYAWWEDEKDAELIEQLSEYFASDRSPDDQSARLMISAYAAYRNVLPLVEAWPSYPLWNRAFLQLDEREDGNAWPFWQLWRLAIAEPTTERAISADFDDSSGGKQLECVMANDSASCAVRSLYEQSPYPKWTGDPPAMRWPAHPLDWLKAVGFAPPAGWPTASKGRPMKVLWVGPGTGQMLTIFASHFGPLVEIWAMDLSLASLGYAARRIKELGLQNLHFVRGDILALPEEITSNAPFDFLESSGVLHHLKKPAEALARLVTLLRPGAPLNLALYSSIARRESATPCRKAGKTFNVSSDQSVRAFRRKLQTLAAQTDRSETENRWVSDIIRTDDFASLTGTRDLCLHPQEKTFTLRQLSKMLDKVGLRWLQFVPTFDSQVQTLFQQRFGISPFSKEATLKKWQSFETEHPTTFEAMYQFFVQVAGNTPER